MLYPHHITHAGDRRECVIRRRISCLFLSLSLLLSLFYSNFFIRLRSKSFSSITSFHSQKENILSLFQNSFLNRKHYLSSKNSNRKYSQSSQEFKQKIFSVFSKNSNRKYFQPFSKFILKRKIFSVFKIHSNRKCVQSSKFLL